MYYCVRIDEEKEKYYMFFVLRSKTTLPLPYSLLLITLKICHRHIFLNTKCPLKALVPLNYGCTKQKMHPHKCE